MKDKQRFVANIPFVIFSVVIGIVSLLDLLDVKLGLTLIFICLGCQNLFIGLRFYKEDKKLRTFYCLIGIGCFLLLFLMVLKKQRLI